MELPQPFKDGLILRAVETDAEAEKVIAINARIHGVEEGAILRHWLFAGHPAMSRSDWLYIEDQSSGAAVATLALMATTWCYGGQPLPVAELGFVATLPDYRGRGLQRVLCEAFDEMALSRGYTLAALEGIPGFYGQFGYEYALPLDGGFDLSFEQIPDQPALMEVCGRFEGDGYVIRKATTEDVTALKKLYDESIAELDIAAPRDVGLWTHRLSLPEEINFYGATNVMATMGKTVGYMRWSDDDWSDRLRILELAVHGGQKARQRIMLWLRYAADRAKAADKCGVRLQLPGDHPAVTVGLYLGAADRGHYGWQVKVLNPVEFIKAIRPSLEARLARSLLAGYDGSLVFDLYRLRLSLRFDEGSLVQVSDAPDKERADARMTLKQATQLWLGWRGREALEAWYPDFWSHEAVRYLLDVLFPKARAYVYTPY